MTDEENIAAIKAYNAERDAMLMLDSVDAMIAFMARYSPHVTFRSREQAEATMHKTRTAIPALPIELRKASHAWLKKRHLHSLDDGELGQ